MLSGRLESHGIDSVRVYFNMLHRMIALLYRKRHNSMGEDFGVGSGRPGTYPK